MNFNKYKKGRNISERIISIIISLLFITNIIADIPVMKVFADSQSSGVQYSNDITLDSDKVIDGDLDISGGTLDLAGHTLTVNGRILQSAGIVNVDKGKLIVSGDYRIQSVSGDVYGNSTGILNMVNDEDRVEVNGSFVTQGYYSYNHLTAGTLEVKGDFIQKYNGWCGHSQNFSAIGTHKVILSGTGVQNVSFENPDCSYFNRLEINNNSQEGIVFTTRSDFKELTNTTGKMNNITTNCTWKVNEDETINGDLNLLGGSIDLNGHNVIINGDLNNSGTINLNQGQLTVGGNIIEPAGIVNVNKGQLIVRKDYRIQSYDGSSYGNSTGILHMVNDADRVAVDGSFVTQGYYHGEHLTAGTLEVKGDFIQKYNGWCGYSQNFNAVGTHKVILSGTGVQNVSFENPESSYFNSLEIRNNSEEGVKCATEVHFSNLIDNVGKIRDLKYKGKWALTSDTIINGDLNCLDGNIDLNGHSLIIEGNLIQQSGTININKGQLIVKKDYRIQSFDGSSYGNSTGILHMVNDADRVAVDGSFVTQGYYHGEHLTAGTLEVKGDFIQKYNGWCGYSQNFNATGIHKVILSGSGSQNVSFENPESSYFNILGIDNPDVSNIKFNTAFKVNNKNALTTFKLEAKNNPKLSKDIEGFIDETNKAIIIKLPPGTDITNLVPTVKISYGADSVAPASGELQDFSKSLSYVVTGQDKSKVTYKVILKDEKAPDAPKDLTITSHSSTTVTLKWTGQNAAGYEIYRDGEKIANTEQTGYIDKGLTTDKTYTYTIKAYNTSGLYSEDSTEVTINLKKTEITFVEPADWAGVGGKLKELYVYTNNTGDISNKHARFEYSKDGENWIYIDKENHQQEWMNNTIRFSCIWDLGKVESGNYKVRCTISDDMDKDSVEKIMNYIVDTTAPGKVENFKALGDAGKINLTWDISKEADVTGYDIYRAEGLDKEFKCIGSSCQRENTKFCDSNVTNGAKYFYKIFAIDGFYQQGTDSEVVSACSNSDIVKPTVLGIEPADNSKIGLNSKIIVHAEDNVCVSKVTLQYMSEGSNEWKDVNTVNAVTVDGIGTATAAFDFNTKDIDGTIKLRAIAYDNAGNASEGTQIRTYTIDKVGPSKVIGLKSTSGTTQVSLNWDNSSDLDIAYYQVEQKDSDNGDFTVAGVVYDKTSVNISKLNMNSNYWFRVVGYDTLGNRGIESDELKVSTNPDTTQPIITDISPKPGYFSKNIPVSISVSDDVGIKSITLQYSKDLNKWDDIVKILQNDIKNNIQVNYDFDVSNLEDGKCYLRGIAEDTSGNLSKVSNEAFYVEYCIDHTAPSVPTGVTIEPTAGDITLKWTNGD